MSATRYLSKEQWLYKGVDFEDVRTARNLGAPKGRGEALKFRVSEMSFETISAERFYK